MAVRWCSVSVDLDPLRCYFQIHGLGEPPSAIKDLVLRRALPRFCELFERHQIAATLFVVGSDIVAPASAQAGSEAFEMAATARAILSEAATAGHELGNHSFSHFYDLSRRSRAEIEREIGDTHQALRALLRRPPTGFRAPGYELSCEMLDVLEAFGYRYDSSLFPCPSYYLSKLLVLGKMALFRERSQSIVTSPLLQLAPTQPFRPDLKKPWRRGQCGIIELPIGVTPHLRLPAIGTSLLPFARLRPWLLRGMDNQPFFNLELHGMDLLDADEDGLPDALRSRQIDLRVPLKERLRALDEMLKRLKDSREMAPLCTIAQEMRRCGQL